MGGQQERPGAVKILSRTEQDLRDRKIECTSMIDEGDPAEVLVDLAQECSADLLVIGNKGMHRRILGSVPNSVTTRRRAPCWSSRRPDSRTTGLRRGQNRAVQRHGPAHEVEQRRRSGCARGA